MTQTRNLAAERGSIDLPFEQKAYEFQQIWDEDWFSDEDYERVQKLAALIPPATTSLLDVGCGNGLFLNHLRKNGGRTIPILVGIDRSEAALEHVETDKQRANVDHLPFAEAKFDTVTCMEVLEHLPLVTYSKAVAEIARVARKCIIVSVPYKQDLSSCMCECPNCRTRFHPDFHVRSYDENVLRSLFLVHSFKVAQLVYIGKEVMRYDREYRMRFRQLFRPAATPEYPSYAICPVCGFFDEEKLSADLERKKQTRLTPRSPSGLTVNHSRLRTFIASTLPARTRYRWIAAVYARA